MTMNCDVRARKPIIFCPRRLGVPPTQTPKPCVCVSVFYVIDTFQHVIVTSVCDW